MKVKRVFAQLGKRKNGITLIVLKELESRKMEIGKLNEAVSFN